MVKPLPDEADTHLHFVTVAIRASLKTWRGLAGSWVKQVYPYTWKLEG